MSQDLQLRGTTLHQRLHICVPNNGLDMEGLQSPPTIDLCIIVLAMIYHPKHGLAQIGPNARVT